ncbi:MAG: sigma 54-interacting transcriptional regulator [Deltaproteobacteria bacterium]|nr:sigma 54-interacting transcriptional regulator [Deltaproteobacteria bacterium]
MGTTNNKASVATTNLRRRAEDRLGEKTADLRPSRIEEDAKRLVHELEVHQIELEIQNAELKRAHDELELSWNNYVDLYDFAPVGYFTFDARGLIREVNLTGARLLGAERMRLVNKPFNSFIADADGREIFSKHREEVFQNQGVATCEIRLNTKDGVVIHVQLQSKDKEKESIDSKTGDIHTTIIDITERKKAAEKIEHLASFPELNPHPVIEIDLQEKVLYCNAATKRILRASNAPEAVRRFLPPDLIEIISDLGKEPEGHYASRDVEIDGRVFNESIILYAKLKVVRIYAQEITVRKRMEDALQKAHDELEKRVEERTVELKTALSEIETMKEQLEAENIYFRSERQLKHQFEHIIGQSDNLKYVLNRAEQVAPTNTTVLILGETGTGKELIATAIHHLSPRKEKALITVNCAALPGNLIESELFGREKGAFTGADTRQIGRFEIANDSTICLDEIGELPLALQAKLLRVIQNHEFERLGSSSTIKVDVRIIATTNRNLEEEVKKGRFRQDLYYRLNVFPITVPPLRQRKEDIPLMVHAFMERHAKKMGKQITSIRKETIKTLQNYAWPGNVRELESIIERAVILCPGPVLQLDDKLGLLSASAVRTLEETERNQILKILSETRWRIEGTNGAAVILGINASTLRARMHKLGIVRQVAKKGAGGGGQKSEVRSQKSEVSSQKRIP